MVEGSEVPMVSVPAPPGVEPVVRLVRWHLNIDEYDRVKRELGVDREQRVFTESGELDWCSFARTVDGVKVFVYGREDWDWPAKIEVVGDGAS